MDDKWPCVAVVGVISCVVLLAIVGVSTEAYIKIKAIDAGLVQGDYGRWVMPDATPSEETKAEVE